MASCTTQLQGNVVFSFLTIPGEQSKKRDTMQNAVQNALSVS